MQPDEITFAVMLRGYGNQNPADWQKIDAVLTQMKMTYGLEPTASKLLTGPRLGLSLSQIQLAFWSRTFGTLVGFAAGKLTAAVGCSLVNHSVLSLWRCCAGNLLVASRHIVTA